MDTFTTFHLYLTQHPIFFYVVIGILATCVGSFINVVSYRFPKMLEAVWRAQCEDMLISKTSFNLCWPRSHCPQCENTIAWYLNIPILSYLFCRGRCHYCDSPIPARYLVVELLTPSLSLLMAWHLGPTLVLCFALAFTWLLVTLTIIDIETMLLPDQLVYSLLWLGLLQSVFTLFCSPTQAILGAIIAYMTLWTIANLFYLFTKREGMGYGDFKLLAALGAWLGPFSLPVILLISSVIGSIVGILALLINRQHIATPIPFGPFLALGGFVTLLIWPFDPITVWFG